MVKSKYRMPDWWGATCFEMGLGVGPYTYSDRIEKDPRLSSLVKVACLADLRLAGGQGTFWRYYLFPFSMLNTLEREAAAWDGDALLLWAVVERAIAVDDDLSEGYSACFASWANYATKHLTAIRRIVHSKREIHEDPRLSVAQLCLVLYPFAFRVRIADLEKFLSRFWNESRNPWQGREGDLLECLASLAEDEGLPIVVRRAALTAFLGCPQRQRPEARRLLQRLSTLVSRGVARNGTERKIAGISWLWPSFSYEDLLGYFLNHWVSEPVARRRSPDLSNPLRLEHAGEHLSRLPGFVFEERAWKMLHAAATSQRPFAILAGPPGTGKTALAILYAASASGILHLSDLTEAKEKAAEDPACDPVRFLADRLRPRLEEEKRGKVVAVQPTWVAPADLVGWWNPLAEGKERFVPGPATEVLEWAAENPGKVFLILDEMNLATPEHYLADLLSWLEARGRVPVYGSADDGDARCRAVQPDGLVIFGTVNLDETTRRLSNRLLGRAFVTVHLQPDWGEDGKPWGDFLRAEATRLLGEGAGRPAADLIGQLVRMLQEARIVVGPRDVRLTLQLARSLIQQGLVGDTALDQALCARILPRVRGGDQMAGHGFEASLRDLSEWAQGKNLAGFARELRRKAREVEELGYTD